MTSRLSAIVLLVASFVPTLYAREITDMVGRKVVVLDKIDRLYAPSPYGAFMMYALAPDLMTGVVFAVKESDRKFLPKSLWNLPVVGGGPQAANPETLAKTRPQLLIVWKNDNNPVNDRATAQFDKMGIPYVFVVADGMTGYPEAIRFLGRLVGREKRAEEMAQLVTKTLTDVEAAANKVPAAKRPKVYYAEGVDGLSTECNDSIHTQVLLLAGDLDIHRCHTSSHMGFEKLSLEQVIMDAPDVILVQERLFFDKVYTDPVWQQVKAVREHRVFYIPHTPLNWFDRPPSFMRFLGLQWTASHVYPAEYKVDMTKETKKFFHVFLGVTLSDRDVQEMLH